MKRLMLLILAVGLFLPSLLHAQAMRTFVSGTGVDTNPCTLAAPCRTFAAAYANTSPGGEIVALDGGGFGPLTITHAITIDGGGQFAGVSPPPTYPASEYAFNISAGASDTVVLRNLSIDGLNTGSVGIFLIWTNTSSGGNLIVENCTIYDFEVSGILYGPNSPSSTLVVRNTSIHGIKQGEGIWVQSGQATLDNVHLNDNDTGLETGSDTYVQNSVAEGNNTGFASDEPGGQLNLVHSQAVSNSFTGVDASGVVYLSDVTLSHNLWPIYVFGGTVFTYGDNVVDGNVNNSFPATPVSKH